MYKKDNLESNCISKTFWTAEKHNDKDKDHGESYFALYFNFLYYSLLSPFRVTHYPSGEYILEHNRFQKMCCACVHINGVMMAIHFATRDRSAAVSSSGPLDIASLFGAVGNISTSVAVACLVKAVWWKQSKILNFIQSSRIHQKTLWKYKEGSWKIGGVCICNCICHLALLYNTASTLEFTDESIGRVIKWSRVQYEWEDENGAIYWLFMIVSKVAYSFVYVILHEASMMYSFSRVTIMVLSIQFRTFGYQFEEFVKEEASVKKIVGKFDSLRSAVDLGNDWSKELILTHYVGILSFLACIPAGTAGFVLSYMIFSYVAYGAFVVASCDLPRRIQSSWKKWMTAKRLDQQLTVEDRLLMVALTQDIDGEAMGLSCPFFTITYSFLGSMVSLAITYGLLVYQVHA